MEYIDSDHELGIRPGKSFVLSENLHVYDQDGKLIATIAVSFPSTRLPKDYKETVGRRLVEFAKEIGHKIHDE